MEFELIRQLEIQLCNPATRKDKARLNELIADEFEEVGKSGTKYSKTEIIEQLYQEKCVSFSAYDFCFTRLAEDCVLVKYVTNINEKSAYRCSIWKKHQQNWKIFYHQGTPTKKVLNKTGIFASTLKNR